MLQPAIKIENFSFSYGSHFVLQDVNLSINPGEYTALIGPNGVGKSTMLKCINRIVQGFGGRIEIFGKDLGRYSQKELARIIGYVPQYQEQLFGYSVFEFVLMARYPFADAWKAPSRKDEEKVGEVLELVQLTDYKDRKVNQISGGERQKVYIAAALAQEPKILLLDEPTAHLDPKYHSQIQNLISKVSKDLQLSVLHVTHDLNHIFSWSQNVVAMKKGRIFLQGSPQCVLTEDKLQTIFDTRFIFVTHPQSNRTLIVPEMPNV